jgi:hypothetical protein
MTALPGPQPQPTRFKNGGIGLFRLHHIRLTDAINSMMMFFETDGRIPFQPKSVHSEKASHNIIAK